MTHTYEQVIKRKTETAIRRRMQLFFDDEFKRMLLGSAIKEPTGLLRQLYGAPCDGSAIDAEYTVVKSKPVA